MILVATHLRSICNRSKNISFSPVVKSRGRAH
jgi:hypothetical protein